MLLKISIGNFSGISIFYVILSINFKFLCTKCTYYKSAQRSMSLYVSTIYMACSILIMSALNATFLKLHALKITFQITAGVFASFKVHTEMSSSIVTEIDSRCSDVLQIVIHFKNIYSKFFLYFSRISVRWKFNDEVTLCRILCPTTSVRLLKNEFSVKFYFQNTKTSGHICFSL